MKRKTIDAARETRLWLGQIIVPTATAVVTVLSIPEVRGAVATKARTVKENIEKKLRRKESQ